MNPLIMVIDDSLTVRMDLGEAFVEAGYRVALCASAAEAREALAAETPALIVLDVVLPDVDGVQLLAEFRTRERLENTPVIMLSSEAAVGDRIRGLTRGANEYVGKPYNAGYVISRATELLRPPQGSDAALTILVIDDSLTYREELGEKLRAAGYRTVLASSGREGLRKASDLHPHAIIVDGVMPEMDGTAVVRRIRLDPGLDTTPCLLLTASEGAASEVEALDSGADAYVRKTEDADIILARIAAIVRAAEDSRDRSPPASLMGPKRILAVDDSPTYLGEIAEQLQLEGYEVVKACSGQDALSLLAVEHVDCILLDLIMPGLSGTETCLKIKGLTALRNVPLIMLTALEDPEAVVAGMNAGADDYVVKTIDFEVIKARLRAQLRRKQFEDENRRVREEILKKDAEARAAQALADMHAALHRELETKNRDLEILNKELEVFAYSVSHDLRQPLRAMDGFSQVLLAEYGSYLDAKGKHYLERVRAGAGRMAQLIDGLLVLSRATSHELRRGPVRLDVLARRVVERLRDAEPDRRIEVEIADGLEAEGDAQLLESVLENLLGNAWKFTGTRENPRIEVGARTDAEGTTYFVRDNGAGFKMAYADKLFAPFQRLHSEREFPGTGIGLATTQRIVRRHGGTIWAEGETGVGATFFFTLDPPRRADA